MKLESLKSSKFEVFKANEISNALSIIGGYIGTTWTSYVGTTMTAMGTDARYFANEGCPSGAVTTSSGWDVLYPNWNIVPFTPLPPFASVGSSGPIVSAPKGFTSIGLRPINLDVTVN